MMMDRIVTSNGVSLHYRVDGPEQGVPLLLCNSIGTTLDLWAPQIETFARRFRVIRYDTRGHGGSSIPPGEYTLDDLGRDALAVLDATGAPTAHVVAGISLGGLTAMWLAVNAPDRVWTLVLANTAARVGTVERWTERIAKVRAEGMAAIASMTMPIWFSQPFREREPPTVETFRRMLSACSPEGYAGCCAALRDGDRREDVVRIRSRTLIIAGETDQTTPASDAKRLQQRIAGSVLMTLDAAHLSNVEQPEAFTRHVAEFLLTGGDVHA